MDYQLVHGSAQTPRLPQLQHPQGMIDASNIDIIVQTTPNEKNQEVKPSKTPHSSIGYRADIDGLRMISIIVVVCHHAWYNSFPGGYMGVEIFFVISGYLISKIIFKELRKQQAFSYSKFYGRRIRRIYPALITMLLYSFYILCECYNSAQLKEASKSLIAACLMAVNVHMMYKDNHHDYSWSFVQVLWTLGVEEQFYLFWPFFATKLWKLPMEKGLIAIGIATFILYQVYYINPNTFGINFIFYPFWQILIGCFVAYYQQKKLQKEQKSQKEIFKANEPVREQTLWEQTKTMCKRSISIKGIISSLATILIIYSLAYQDAGNRSDFLTLTVILSTAVFIHCGMGIFNDLILGNWVAIFIGKISYSWYLLHFPLLKFCNFCSPNVYVNVGTSFVLAILCTYGIENNIRFNKSKCVVPALVIVMGLLVILFKNASQSPQVWAKSL